MTRENLLQLSRQQMTTERYQELPAELNATMPEGLRIHAVSYGGHGLFATRPFKSGERIYVASCILVPDVKGTVKLNTSDGQHFLLTTDTHSVLQPDGMRQLYTFDAFVNHSCDPNTCSEVLSTTSAAIEYAQIASRDLAAGEELTCDYNLFEYDNTETGFDPCKCGSSLCVGKVLGFKHLTLEAQRQRVKDAEPYIIEAWLQENPQLRHLVE